MTSKREALAEFLRVKRRAEINAAPRSREELSRKYGQVWSTGELQRDFNVLGFVSPFVVVTRREDNQKGSLEFQHEPRFFFNWKPDVED